MEKKRCAIATITGGTNYGNRLQNYAMEYVIKKEHLEVCSLSRGYINYLHRYSLKEKLYIVYALIFQKNGYVPLKRRIIFRRFDKLYINQIGRAHV